MEKEKIKELLGLWKTTNRLTFVAGAVACSMFLGLSFIRPYLEKYLALVYFPGIIYAFYYAYKIRKVSQRLNEIKESVNNQEKR